MSYINRCQDLVKSLLGQYPVTRDDDYRLLVNLWVRELKAKHINVEKLSAIELLKLISKGEVSPIESVTRCRRKLQEEFPSLRGAKYAERKKKAMEVSEDMRTVTKQEGLGI